MTDRWWAPQRATTEPDAVVLAMLEPGDLGSALLAAHRAGAAAMETVSKGALPSEERLTGAMVTARAKVSDRVVDSVANAVSTPTYAALLVRDVLDDAEQGALAVYRTAVAKGVSPPLAAARASAIYGVPAHALGTYLALAATPGSNPAALTDAADRALMTFVSKLVSQEELVEVSKAPTADHHPEPTVSAGWDEKEHPRGPVGQFVRKQPGGGLPTTYLDPGEREAPARPTPATQADGPPEAGTLAWLRAKLGMAPLPGSPEKVADVQTPAPARPVARKARKVRQARQVAATPTAETTRTVQNTRTADTVRTASDQRMAELTRITDEVNRATGSDPDPEGPPDTDHPTAPDYLLDHGWRVPMQQPYDLDPSFSLTLGTRQASTFMKTIASQAGGLADPSARVFRLGYLMDLAGEAQTSASPETKANLRALAKDVTDSDEYQDAEAPVVSVIHPQDLNRNKDDTKAYITKRKFDMAAGKTVGFEEFPAGPDPAVLKRIKAMPLWKPVGANELDDENRLYDKPEIAIVKFAEGVTQPSVDEFVIDWGARGHEPDVRGGSFELDPHQAYEFKNKPGADPGSRLAPQRLWDGEHGVIVNRWYLKPVDDSWVQSLLEGGSGGVGKAERFADPPNPIRPSHTEFEQLHPRDEDGRFTETETRESLPSPASSRLPGGTVPRQARQVRRARTVRQTVAPRAASGDRTADTVRTAGTERTAGTARTAMTNALAASSLRHAVETHRQKAEEAAPHEDLPELPVLDDRARYVVLSSYGLTALLRDNYLEGSGSGILSDARWVTSLKDHHILRDGEGVMGALNYNTQEDINETEGTPLGPYGWQRKSVGKGLLRPGSDDDELNLGNHIARLFANRPEIAQIHIDYGQGSYTLYANKEPVKPQAIIEVDEELDWEQPIEIVQLGSYRANEMLMRRRDIPGAPLTSAISHQGIGDGAPANAAAMAFLMQNPRVDRYRMQNTDERGWGDGDVPLYPV